MSAVMSTLSMISGGRRAHRKLVSSRKSGQLSDAGDERTRSQHDLSRQQRSASLQTLETGNGVANLENLEAKMASIEVSLGAARRRSACARDASRELDALRSALCDKDTLIQNLKKQLSASLSAARLASQAPSPAASRSSSHDDSPPAAAALSADERRALDERAAAVRADLETRRANIQDLRARLEKTHVTDNIDTRIQQVKLQYQLGREELETRPQLDRKACNIDTRIQQAELQYQLGREELEALSLGEQARALAHLIRQADAAARRHHPDTLYSAVRECGGAATVVAAEARGAAWAAAARGPGLALTQPGDGAALRPGDRLVEVNGTMVVSSRSAEEVQRALGGGGGGDAAARLVVLRARPADSPPPAPSPDNHPAALTQSEAASLRAEVSALRGAAEAARRAKEGLRADNTRLTHRISYLEDQVAELVARHHQLQPASSTDSSCITVNKTKKNVTNINITSEPHAKSRQSPKSEVQVFQKGPDITAIVAKLPGLEGGENNLPLLRPRSQASHASHASHASRVSPPPASNHRAPSAQSLESRARMRHSLSHHCVHDYSVETDAAIRMIERNQRHIEKQRLKSERISRREDYLRSDSDLDLHERHSGADPHREIRKAADRIEESIKKTNWAERKTLSIIEQLKRSQRLRKSKKSDSADDAQESEKHLYNRIDGKVLENAHKSSRRSSKLHSRSAKSSELESEPDANGDAYGSSPRLDYGSECSARPGSQDGGRARPQPPRKPLRLSLHKARSAHSLLGEEPLSQSQSQSPAACRDKRPAKRTHGADRTPRPPRRAPHPLAPAPDTLYPDTHAPNWC